jgi:uncharacterized protein
MSDSVNEPLSERVVPCPTCRGPAVYGARNAFRPFCSERCRNVDLGAWATEKFRVADAPPSQDDAGGAPPDLH